MIDRKLLIILLPSASLGNRLLPHGLSRLLELVRLRIRKALSKEHTNPMSIYKIRFWRNFWQNNATTTLSPKLQLKTKLCVPPLLKASASKPNHTNVNENQHLRNWAPAAWIHNIVLKFPVKLGDEYAAFVAQAAAGASLDPSMGGDLGCTWFRYVSPKVCALRAWSPYVSEFAKD